VRWIGTVFLLGRSCSDCLVRRAGRVRFSLCAAREREQTQAERGRDALTATHQGEHSQLKPR